MEQEFILGTDLYPDDNLLDQISFSDIILMLHCNEKALDIDAVKRCFLEAIESRIEEALFILDKNADEMIRLAKIGRGEYE